MINSIFAAPVTTSSAAVGAALGVEDCQVPVGVIVAGTFTATVLVEVCFDSKSASPTWVQFGSSLSAPGTVKVDIPCMAVRVRVSAYTSGSVVSAISALLGTV